MKAYMLPFVVWATMPPAHLKAELLVNGINESDIRCETMRMAPSDGYLCYIRPDGHFHHVCTLLHRVKIVDHLLGNIGLKVDCYGEWNVG